MSNLCTCVECMPDSQEPTFDELLEVVKEKQAAMQPEIDKLKVERDQLQAKVAEEVRVERVVRLVFLTTKR